MAPTQQTPQTGGKQSQKSGDRGRDQRILSERSGTKVDGDATHPVERRTGHKAESNVGEDETSGDG